MSAAILPDLPADQYHADQVADVPTLSASIACAILEKSPAHVYAEHPRLNPRFVKQEKKRVWEVGTAAHSLLLEGYDVAHVVEGYDNWTTKDAQTEAAEARANSKIPLLRREWEEVSAMVDAARDQIAASSAEPPLLADGKPEQTLVFDVDGVACRARLDWLRDDHTAVDDYKTSQSAKPRWFMRKGIYDNGYATKAAFYLRAVKEATGVDAKFRWLVQEKKPPYALSVLTPNDDVLAYGALQVGLALEIWRDCLESGIWPAYTTAVVEAEAPSWVLSALSNQFEEAAWAQM